jgi:hypothetical protein
VTEEEEEEEEEEEALCVTESGSQEASAQR